MNHKSKCQTFLEESIEENLYDIWLSKDFLSMAPNIYIYIIMNKQLNLKSAPNIWIDTSTKMTDGCIINTLKSVLHL